MSVEEINARATRATELGFRASGPWETPLPTISSPKTGLVFSACRACPEGASATEWVKCTIFHRGNSYKCHLDSNGVPYSPRDIDFIAALVIPTETWYILPIRATHGQSDLLLTPRSNHAQYEKYREALDLLKR